MKKRVRVVLVMAVCPVLAVLLFKAGTAINLNPRYHVGQPIDNFHGVVVYYNGGVAHSAGRNLAPDGYNLGLRYQCVEFVKRYYYEHLHHKMPDSYGHAKDFFDRALADGGWNARRGLTQYRNGGAAKPQAGDLLVFGPTLWNRYGHVAIIASISDQGVEIVQQNPGPFGKSREAIPLKAEGGGWKLENRRVLGWLRKLPGGLRKATCAEFPSRSPRANSPRAV